jgi:Raf kinase inhibitor-like YbhB/YbcL family protein
MAFILRSPAFKHLDPMPEKYTSDGEDISPPLEWSGAPEDTRSLVLICGDPGASNKEPFVHWLIYNISDAISALPEGLSTDQRFVAPVSADQGINSCGRTGYSGPRPPVWHGQHRYVFRLHALDSELELNPGATKEQLLDAMAGKVLATTELIGTYKRTIRKALRAA